MGYMTTVTVLNDCFDQIKKNPDQFIDGILQMMHDGGTISVGSCGNPVEVMRTHHADDFRVYLSDQNSTYDINPWDVRFVGRCKQNPHLLNSVLNSIEKARLYLDQMEERLRNT